jgi:D-3-phosphoglycerate dehydrogenase / 2-oxoglutarate reductase
MAITVKTMNKISPNGLSLLGDAYDISEDHATPEAIIVRSAKVNTDDYDGLLAVARAGAGTNNVTVAEAADKGICVFNAPGANANAVAELVFTGLGMAVRNVPQALAFADTLKEWDDDALMNKEMEGKKSSFRGVELTGRRMAVVGLGKIGVLVANAAAARGMSVVAYEPFPNAANMHMLAPAVEYVSELGAALLGAEFVSAHVPLLDATQGLLNKDSLSVVADGAIISNFARGPVVKNEDILSLLDSGKIAKYVNDFPTKQLLANDKCICLPHLGASTGEAEENCATMVVEQLKDYMQFGIVKNSVNFPSVGGYPAPSVKTRVVVINKDVPNMIADITSQFGDAGVNIHSFKNESNGKLGYNIVDVEAEVAADVISGLESLENVVRVRTLSF